MNCIKPRNHASEIYTGIYYNYYVCLTLLTHFKTLSAIDPKENQLYKSSLWIMNLQTPYTNHENKAPKCV